MFWGKQRSSSSPSRLCCSSFPVSVLNFATSPNSSVKFLWGFLRSERSILRFIFFWLCVLFLVFYFLLLRSRDRCQLHCYTPTPQLGRLRASPWRSHRRKASSTGPAAPAARATTHQVGGVVGKRLQPQLLSDTLTGEWRNGEAGEGQGSEPREPGGLHHQAGGVSWRAPR